MSSLLKVDDFCRQQREVFVSDLNAVAENIIKYIQVINGSEFSVAQVWASKELDDLVSDIGAHVWNSGEQKKIDATVKSDTDTYVYIVSELYKTGGHTPALFEIIAAKNNCKHVIFVTNIFGSFEEVDFKEYMESSMASDADLIVVPDMSYIKKIEWLQASISEIAPQELFLFNHHQDVVAIASSLKQLCENIFYYHHADHHLALGVFLGDAIHIDPHNLGYYNCRNHLHLSDNIYWPITVTDRGVRDESEPFMRDRHLTTCTTGGASKIELEYEYKYKDIVAGRLKAVDGIHYHIGSLSDSYITEIYSSLEENDIDIERFVYVEWVDSIWLFFIDKKIDLYISSFPVAGGTASLECMGSGTPLIMHDSYKSNFQSGLDLAYDGVLTWSDPEEFYSKLRELNEARLRKYSSLGRDHYLKYHHPDVLKRILSSEASMRTGVTPPELHKQPTDVDIVVKRINSADTENHRFHQIINQLNQEVMDRDEVIHVHESIIRKRDAVVLELEEQNAELKNLIDNMQQSISWRIAEPVRFAGKHFRYVKANGFTIVKMMLTVSGWRKILNKIKIIVRGQIYRFAYRLKYKFRKKPGFEKHGVSEVPRGRVIVVSHNANKEGAPLLALNIVKHLNNNFNYDVVTILASGGDLTGEFKKVSTVYRYDLLKGKEISNLFDGLINDGFDLALCNTSVVGNIVEALNKAGVRCTTLVHELPYVVKIANLHPSINKIISNSESIVFPAAYVKNKLESLFDFDDVKTSIRHQGRFMSNPHLFDKERAGVELRRHLGCDSKTKLVIGIGYGEYRKGIDLFVETGIKVAATADNVLFVWVGNCKILEFEKVQVRIKQQGCQNVFKFIGYEKDIGLYYSGADVFFLSSREDPFPSVYIDAISAGLPVVAFDDAGGFVEFQKKINGILVSDLNINTAAGEISNLLSDENAYQQYENSALAAAKEFGFNSYLYDLLEFSGVMLKKVSVIIPNYNYEQYIEGRLNSIFQQTVKPFEIILLDDNSKDNSLAVAQELLENSGIDYSVFANKENNGCYKQWLKGISQAKGDYVWIAEADDLCRPDFIEKLLPKFDNDINLVYCQSIAIDKNSEETAFSYLEYTKEFSETRWCSDFTNNGEDEIVNYLVRMNTIPNASGVIMRKSALDGVDKYLKEFTSTGDWLTYVYALSSGGISYVSEKLNYHRRHDNSIIHTVMHEPKLLKEILLVSRHIVENYEISNESKMLLAKRFNDYYSLISSGKASLSEDEMFKNFFHENGLDDLWGYVLKT